MARTKKKSQADLEDFVIAAEELGAMASDLAKSMSNLAIEGQLQAGDAAHQCVATARDLMQLALHLFTQDDLQRMRSKNEGGRQSTDA